MRFKLYKQGPNDSSTHPECWGHRNSPGRLIAEADWVDGLIDAASMLWHNNWCVHDTKKNEWIQPEDFWNGRERRVVPNA